MHRREIDRLIGMVDRKGYTLVPLSLYWSKGRAKLDVGLAKGKKMHDKRDNEKDRDWERQKSRIMKASKR
jgi:SsrA-binding protein